MGARIIGRLMGTGFLCMCKVSPIGSINYKEEDSHSEEIWQSPP